MTRLISLIPAAFNASICHSINGLVVFKAACNRAIEEYIPYVFLIDLNGRLEIAGFKIKIIAGFKSYFGATLELLRSYFGAA